MAYTHEEIYQRRQWVADKVAKRWVRGLIHYKYKEQWPNLSKVTFDKDYREAMSDFRDMTDDTRRKDMLAEAIAVRVAMASELIEAKDFKLGLEVEKDLSKLLGLYEKDNGQKAAVVEINLGEPDMESVEEAEEEVLLELQGRS